MITGIIFIIVGIVGHYYCKSRADKAKTSNVVLEWAEKLIPLVFITLGLSILIYCYYP